MFTGLITAVGTVHDARARDGGIERTIDAPWNDLTLGESVAVDGACLTVAHTEGGHFQLHLVATSLERTAFQDYRPGRRVNLERALRIGDRLGGHMVQGHVDGVGHVVAVSEHQDARLIDIEVPEAVACVSIPLGSITVDGVSLTINAAMRDGLIQVSIIPFTLQHTTLRERRPGDRVHLEGDMVGKYLRAFVKTPHVHESGS